MNQPDEDFNAGLFLGEDTLPPDSGSQSQPVQPDPDPSAPMVTFLKRKRSRRPSTPVVSLVGGATVVAAAFAFNRRRRARQA